MTTALCRLVPFEVRFVLFKARFVMAVLFLKKMMIKS